MNERPPPLDLRLVAWVFLIVGLDAAYTAIIDLVRHAGAQGYPIGVLCIPCYFGLIRGWQVWRKLALALLAMYAGLATIVIPILYFSHLPPAFELLGHRMITLPYQFGPLYFCASLVLVIWEWRVLTRPNVVALFSGRPTNSRSAAPSI